MVLLKSPQPYRRVLAIDVIQPLPTRLWDPWHIARPQSMARIDIVQARLLVLVALELVGMTFSWLVSSCSSSWPADWFVLGPVSLDNRESQ